MNYKRFLNSLSLARRPSPIRLLTALLARSKPTMISLAGGNPNPLLFPFQEAEFKLRDGTVLKLSEERMKVALQYGPTQGLDELVSILKKFQTTLHSPPATDQSSILQSSDSFDLCITPGSADAICKSIEMLVEPGDAVLIEEPTYPGTLAALRPYRLNFIPVETDHDGMIPESLLTALSRYTPVKQRPENSINPKFLYTIPNGCNPTGASLSYERKKKIYQIAREYDLLILEDDPYYFLQFSKPRVPSYQSIDVDGRVLRFDSMSKIMSSGLRIGYVSGPTALIKPIALHMMCSSMHTCSLSQVMVCDLLKVWNIEGFEQHIDKVVAFYRDQKDAMMASASKWLTGLAEWSEPQAGMFVWLKLIGIKDSKQLIEEKALKKEVLLVPGSAFMIDSEAPVSHVRAAFSLATPQQMDAAFQRLSVLIRDEQSG